MGALSGVVLIGAQNIGKPIDCLLVIFGFGSVVVVKIGNLAVGEIGDTLKAGKIRNPLFGSGR